MSEKLVGIIGWPVTHSLSPKMHNHAFLKLGLDWRYVYLPVEDKNLKEAVLGLKALGFMGANITVPYKEAILPLMDKLSDEASNIGAVNTIQITDGLFYGHNTDAQGFTNDLIDHDIDISSMKVLLLGAGGSARAIAYGLISHGLKKLTILNRTKSKAEDIAKSFSPKFGVEIKIDPLAKNSAKEHRADLIINTTSIGLADPHISPLDGPFSSDQIIYDIIYGRKTKLLEEAKFYGAKTIDGLGMLIHQGALSLSLWTGQKAPVEIMKEALR